MGMYRCILLGCCCMLPRFDTDYKCNCHFAFRIVFLQYSMSGFVNRVFTKMFIKIYASIISHNRKIGKMRRK